MTKNCGQTIITQISMIGMLLLGLFARDFDKLYFLTNNLYSFLAILVQLIFSSKICRNQSNSNPTTSKAFRYVDFGCAQNPEIIKRYFWQETWQSIKIQRNNNAFPGLVKQTFTTLVAVTATIDFWDRTNIFEKKN